MKAAGFVGDSGSVMGEFNYFDIFEFANPMLTPLVVTDPCACPRMCA